MKLILAMLFSMPIMASTGTAVFEVNSNTLVCRSGYLSLGTEGVALPGSLSKSYLSHDFGFQTDCDVARASILEKVSGQIELPIQFQSSREQSNEVAGCRISYNSGATHCTAVEYCTVHQFSVLKELLRVTVEKQTFVGRFEKKGFLGSVSRRRCIE